MMEENIYFKLSQVSERVEALEEAHRKNNEKIHQLAEDLTQAILVVEKLSKLLGKAVEEPTSLDG